MFLQPVRDGGRLAVAEQVNGPAGLDVDEDGAVVPAAAEREIVNAQNRHCAGLGVGQRHDQAQHGGPGGRQVQFGGEPGPGPPGQRQADRGQHPGQRRRPPGPRRGQALELLGERDRLAAGVAAEEPAHPEPERHRVPADRRVGKPAQVPAVHPFRELAASPAVRAVRAGVRPDAQPAVLQFAGFRDDPGQVRQQHLQADPALA
jgi:hypothetical protein